MSRAHSLQDSSLTSGENVLPKKKILSEKQRKHLQKIHAARSHESMMEMNKKGVAALKLKKLKRLQVEQEAEQRLLRGVDKALNSMLIATEGTHRVVVKSFDDEGKLHIETVRDINRIDALLATGVYGEDYLILAGAEPDWRAADAFLSRALGKPKESLNVKVDHSFSLIGLARERQKLPAHVPLPVEARVVESAEALALERGAHEPQHVDAHEPKEPS